MRALWNNSVDVSALSYVLARGLRSFDPDRALLGGLVHDIGVIPILSYVERAALNPSAAVLEQVVRKLRAPVGAMVARQWGLDNELTNVITECKDWMRDPGPATDLCDVVLIAQHFRFADTQTEILPPFETLPVHRRLVQALDMRKMVSDAAREIAGIKSWLGTQV